ncbi:MAG: trypsin-like peptidase domain-containing protein [Flavobacteriales bacterium]|jgi:V8-like Glu-specific endopeptidase|nr:trypsin-like peptidase domain-containing protein [Flavobacteriales bacterium]
MGHQRAQANSKAKKTIGHRRRLAKRSALTSIRLVVDFPGKGASWIARFNRPPTFALFIPEHMRAPLLINAVLLAIVHTAKAQETTGAVPLSLRMGLALEGVPTAFAEPFDQRAAAAADAVREAENKVPLYGRFVDCAAALHTHGSWTELPGGDRIWRLRVESPGALATELFFESVNLPAGSQLHMLAADGSTWFGGYTSAHVRDGLLSTDRIMGDACVIEYHEPASVRGEGSFDLRSMAHAYRMEGLLSGECQVDVACPEGSTWQDQVRSVMRIRVVDPAGVGFCTGVLMNNSAQDCKNYVLTANHCTMDSNTSNFSSFQFRWNYQQPSCDGSGVVSGFNVVGCTRRADSNDNGGDNGSDFTLVELNSAIPASVNPYYAGWDATNTAPAGGVCIHHPDGDYKKISSFTSTAVSTTWGGPSGTHWRVTWAATASGHGVTEGGSSGSPIFNSAKRVVGTLTGGSSFCDTPTAPDFFGKMSYHFGTGNPNPAAEELKNWLAPEFNVTALNGSNNPCATIGVDERPMPSPEVAPNPSIDIFSVTLPEALNAADLWEARDVTGRLVAAGRIQSERFVIDAAEWGEGAYLLSVLSASQALGGTRIVKQ